MKIYVHGNKWALRGIGAVLALGPALAVAVHFAGAAVVFRVIGTSLAWTGIVSVIVLGVGILGSTFGKEKE
jgi:hypothetical protein